MHGKIRVYTSEISNEVVFERANCVLGFVGLLEVGWNQLENNFVGTKISFECDFFGKIKIRQRGDQAKIVEVFQPH